MPRIFRLRLEHIQGVSLGVGVGAVERKPYLVKCATICLDKRKGGLGVRCPSLLNKALLCKWS